AVLLPDRLSLSLVRRETTPRCVAGSPFFVRCRPDGPEGQPRHPPFRPSPRPGGVPLRRPAVRSGWLGPGLARPQLRRGRLLPVPLAARARRGLPRRPPAGRARQPGCPPGNAEPLAPRGGAAGDRAAGDGVLARADPTRRRPAGQRPVGWPPATPPALVVRV